MVFLGLTYDTVKMSIEVPPDKLHNTFELIRHWLTSLQSTKSDLQSIIGKLSYICACNSPGKFVMQRLLNELRQLNTLILFPVQKCCPIYIGGTSSSLSTTAFYCCIPLLGLLAIIIFVLMPALLVLVVSFAVISSTPLFRDASIQPPFQMLCLKCWPLLSAPCCGPMSSAVLKF